MVLLSICLLFSVLQYFNNTLYNCFYCIKVWLLWFQLDDILIQCHLTSLCLHMAHATLQSNCFVTVSCHLFVSCLFNLFLQKMSTGLDTSVQTTIIHLPFLFHPHPLPHPSISRSMCLSCCLWCVCSLIWLDSSCAAREPSSFPVWPAANWWGYYLFVSVWFWSHHL